MNTAPRIPGYEFGQRLLLHPLAEIWRGRSGTGLEVVAIVLSEAGADDPQIRQRLDQASRSATSESLDAPLWAANFAGDRPYAITQLIPGQSGAERLLDPLDGVIGNDQASVDEVRRQLQHFGTAPVPHPPGPSSYQPGQYDVPGEASSTAPGPGQFAVQESEAEQALLNRRRTWKFYAAMAVTYLMLFSITYSVGAAFNKKDDASAGATTPVPPAVSPSALPTSVVLPGIDKAPAPRLNPRLPSVSVIGATYTPEDALVPVLGLDLPFSFRWPDEPGQIKLGESSYAIYRRVISGENPQTAPLSAALVVHPCKSLAACRQERTGFDQRWTARFKAPVPATAKDGQTWFTEQQRAAYVVSMTRAFEANGQWWLVGVAVTAPNDQRAAAQRVLNDIRTQTS